MLSIRKIGLIGKTYRHLNRYRQILGILFKYGFDDIIDRLKIDQYIEVGLQMISRKKRHKVERFNNVERIRLIFEELGPTFIKFGQALSTRHDFLPESIIKELSKLQDNVPAFPFQNVKQIIEKELGQPVEQVYLFIDKKPVASASIGQVHFAKSRKYGKVAIKVQRPNIKKTIEIDLEIMLHLATLMERHIKEFALHKPVKIVEEFARTLEKEIDYTIEAVNMERMAFQFENNFHVYIPAVFQDLTTEHIITMEYIEGIKISDIKTLEKRGMDKKLITSRGANFFLKQIFDFGFFHADPHPGNIFILPHNIICLLDFGMTGFINRKTRELFIDLIEAVVFHESGRATKILLQITLYDNAPDINLLERDVSDFMDKYLFKSLKNINVGKLFHDIIDITYIHSLRLPPNIFMMLKAFASVEGIAILLDPEFNMVTHAKPFIKKIKIARLSPNRIRQDIIKIGSDFLNFINDFPAELLKISTKINQDNLHFKIEIKNLDNILNTHDRVSSRISFSIIIAALIMGSALILISGIPPLIWGVSFIGIIGFIAAAVMGVWLLLSILKTGKL